MEQDVEVKPAEGAKTETPAAARKAYSAPRLRRLGSVRELTFGSVGIGLDANTLMPMM